MQGRGARQIIAVCVLSAMLWTSFGCAQESTTETSETSVTETSQVTHVGATNWGFFDEPAESVNLTTDDSSFLSRLEKEGIKPDSRALQYYESKVLQNPPINEGETCRVVRVVPGIDSIAILCNLFTGDSNSPKFIYSMFCIYGLDGTLQSTQIVLDEDQTDPVSGLDLVTDNSGGYAGLFRNYKRGGFDVIFFNNEGNNKISG